MDFIRNILASRGAQLFARLITMGLVWLAAKAGVSFSGEDLGITSTVLGSLAAALILFVFDLVAHKVQKKENVEKEIDRRIDAGMLPMILCVLALGLLSGCTPTGHVGVTTDINGNVVATGGIDFKKLEAQRRSAAKAQCQACVKSAMAAEMQTFKTGPLAAHLAQQAAYRRELERCGIAEYVNVSTTEQIAPLPEPATILNGTPPSGVMK